MPDTPESRPAARPEANWTKLKDILVTAAAIVILLAALFSLYSLFKGLGGGPVSEFPVGLFGLFPTGSGRAPGTQSPVRIVGGSLKAFEAQKGWMVGTACPNNTQCIVSQDLVDTTTFALDGIDDTAGSFEPTAWIGLASAWQIALTMRTSNAGTLPANVITICPTTSTTGSAACAAATSASTFVMAYISTNSGSSGSFAKESDDDTGISPLYGYTDSRGSNKPSDASFPLERIGAISVSGIVSGQTYMYNCHDGLCAIYIGH